MMIPERVKPSPSPFEQIQDLFRKTPEEIPTYRNIRTSPSLINIYATGERKDGELLEYIVESRNFNGHESDEAIQFSINQQSLRWIIAERQLHTTRILRIGNISQNIPVPSSQVNSLANKVYIPKDTPEKDKQAMTETLVNWITQMVSENRSIAAPISLITSIAL